MRNLKFRDAKKYWAPILGVADNVPAAEMAALLQAKFPKIQFDGDGTPVFREDAGHFLVWAMRSRQMATEYGGIRANFWTAA